MNITDSSRIFEKNAIEAAIKIGILGTMVVLTIRIIQPFVMPVLWGIIIAVAVEPFIGKLARRLGGRRKMASILFALVVIAALVIPSVMLVSSSIDTVQSVATSLENDTLTVPPPPAGVEEWPIIGSSLNKSWSLASSNLGAALQKFEPQLKAAAGALLGKVGGGVMAVFMFIISVAIAAALLATAEKGSATMTRIVSRFAGDKGPEIITLGTATIRGVMQGVIGVAVIQAILAAIGMVIVGVPAAGLWAGLVLLLAVIQLPPILILGPIAAWVFTFTDTMPAVFFLVWAILVSGCDGFLKPVLMGRGVDAPMLVILIGALGGMMLSGIIGLFVGAVVVAITYTLFMAWIEEEQITPPATETDVND
ncbi:MAG: AI-2E family transporter [Desulfobulbaceae bacterium]|nr:AI-2E family transporter [Desulfobulbaceae bacterium]